MGQRRAGISGRKAGSSSKGSMRSMVLVCAVALVIAIAVPVLFAAAPATAAIDDPANATTASPPPPTTTAAPAPPPTTTITTKPTTKPTTKTTTKTTTKSTTTPPTTKSTTTSPTTKSSTTTTTTPGTTTTSTTISTSPSPSTESPSQKIQSAVLAKGWIPFTVILVVCLLYAWIFVGYYQHPREKEFGSSVVTILAISSALIAATIVPVDVYITSQFKHADGTWQEWALQHEDYYLNVITYGYYAAYALIMLFVFLFVPLSYFFFEEKDEVERTSCGKRLCQSFKFTFVLLIVMAVLMCIGAFAITTGGDTCTDDKVNATNWQKWSKCRANFAEHAITDNNGASAISFTIGLLTVAGVIYFIFYTATGFVYLPINMIRSRLSNKSDQLEVTSRIRANEERRSAVREKYRNNKKKRTMSRKDRRLLDEAEHENRVLERASRRADRITNGFMSKFFTCLRPFEFIFGIVFFFLSLFIVASLAVSAGDKLLQITQQHLNWKTGYSQAAPRVPNPLDIILRALQPVFPLDYVVVILLIFYFLSCTMAGVRALGVRFCGYKVFDIRRGRSVPQALLFLSTIVIFTLLFVNIVMLTLAPQYITYGNQRYPAVPDFNNKTGIGFAGPIGKTNATLCTSEAPEYTFWVVDTVGTNVSEYVVNAPVYSANFTNDCLPISFQTNLGTFELTESRYQCKRVESCVATRVSALLHSFFYNMWFLGLIYYWANWGFVLIFILALIYIGCKRRKSLIANLVNESRHDFNDSDDDMTPFNPSWL